MEEERRKVDLQSSESYFVLAAAAPAVLKSSRKKRLHTVWQGPQKADGVLCNKHLGLFSRKTLDPISNHLLVLITTSILVLHQLVEFFWLSTKSHLCVKGESSFWVRHVATIPAFLIVKCQSETEEVLTI